MTWMETFQLLGLDLLALMLMDHALRHRAQCGDVVCPTPKIAARAPQSAGAHGNIVEDLEPDEA